MKCICGYEQKTNFECYGDLYCCPKCGTLKINVPEKHMPINVEMSGYSVSGKPKQPDKGCTLKLFNEDGDGNIIESASIYLSMDRIKNLRRFLSTFLHEEEKKPENMNVYEHGVKSESKCICNQRCITGIQPNHICIGRDVCVSGKNCNRFFD